MVIDDFEAALKTGGCHIWVRPTAAASREILGSQYVAAIAEQRPGCEGHGYPGGMPDWDTGAASLLRRWPTPLIPMWMSLPYVRRRVHKVQAGVATMLMQIIQTSS